MDFITQPWAWYVAGPMIALVLFFTFYFGKNFGVSTNLETICSIGGAGKISDFFKTDWKKQTWGLVLIFGMCIGGWIAIYFLTPDTSINLNPKTITELENLGFKNAGQQYLPNEIFETSSILSIKGFCILLISGFLIGFGSRYAGGCTSGHAITGLSNLEKPSLLAVIGFFIGGLIMSWFLLPLIF